jgi:hypothetical protein
MKCLLEFHQICRKYDIKNYIINPDRSIVVDGDLDLSFKGLSELPVRFGIVSGSFYCDNNKLTSLWELIVKWVAISTVIVIN